MNEKNENEFESKYNFKSEDKNLLKFVDHNSLTVKSIQLVGKPKKLFKEILKRFFSNTYSVIALFIFLFILITAIIVVYTSQYSASKPITNAQSWMTQNLPPSNSPDVTALITADRLHQIQLIDPKAIIVQGVLSPKNGLYLVTYNAYDLLSTVASNTAGHAVVVTSILGTTTNGFDIWTRSWTSALNSILLALIVATLNTFIGVAIGLYLGFHIGQWIDTFFSRIIDVFNGLPALIWVLILVSIIGTNFWQLIFILVIIGWSGPVAEARFFAVSVKDEEYVSASQAVGASKMRRIYVHVFPAIAGKLGISYVQSIPNVILIVASLAFLGFLTNPDNANLGTVLNQAVGEFSNNIWILIFPSLILLLITLSLQFVAIGVHDALDPKVKNLK